MPLLTLPNELLLLVAKNLIDRPRYINSLLQTNSRFAFLLTPLLNVLAVKDKDGWTALQWAAQRGYESLASLVLAKGVDVNAADNFFRHSAMHLAVRNRHIGFIGILLANGADVSDPESRRMALNLAAREGRDDIVKLLLKNGADADVNDGVLVYGATALHWAASNGYEAIVRLLLDNGADVAVQANYGGCALGWAKQQGREEVCRVLLGMNVEFSVPN